MPVKKPTSILLVLIVSPLIGGVVAGAISVPFALCAVYNSPQPPGAPGPDLGPIFRVATVVLLSAVGGSVVGVLVGAIMVPFGRSRKSGLDVVTHWRPPTHCLALSIVAVAGAPILFALMYLSVGVAPGGSRYPSWLVAFFILALVQCVFCCVALLASVISVFVYRDIRSCFAAGLSFLSVFPAIFLAVLMFLELITAHVP